MARWEQTTVIPVEHLRVEFKLGLRQGRWCLFGFKLEDHLTDDLLAMYTTDVAQEVQLDQLLADVRSELLHVLEDWGSPF